MYTITVDEFHQVLRDEKDNHSTAFINVCTPEEYVTTCIPGVKNMPLSDLASRVHELKDKSIIYIHCASGTRSALAVDMFAQLGVQAQLINVEGGLMSWTQAGLETTAGVSE